MKNIFTTLLSAITITAAAQQVPIDFETGGHGADWTWTVFENDDNPALEIVENPDPSGINTSNTVAKFTARQTGQTFAGCESLHGADIGDYKIDANNSTITIMVYKTVLSDVGIKLVTSSSWSKGELKVANTKTNQWEEITFDFSTIDHENMTYDQIVIFPDFNARSEETISYFDNLTIGGRTASLKNLEPTTGVVYPNPASSQLHIEVDQRNINSYTLTSITGQIVKDEKLNASGPQTDIDISDLSKGIYLLNISTENGILNKKVIIE